jgi:hypothetical protein
MCIAETLGALRTTSPAPSAELLHHSPSRQSAREAAIGVCNVLDRKFTCHESKGPQSAVLCGSDKTGLRPKSLWPDEASATVPVDTWPQLLVHLSATTRNTCSSSTIRRGHTFLQSKLRGPKSASELYRLSDRHLSTKFSAKYCG